MKNNRFVRMLDILITSFMMLNVFSVSLAAEISGDVYDILLKVVTVLLTVAGFVCVGQLIIIGIKFMLSSAAEKSNAKTALLPWLIGTIVCFGASWVGGTIIDILRVKKDVLSY